MAQALIGLGANLGDRAATLDEAVRRLATTPGVTLAACSRWHETSPVGGPAGQPPFLNGVALFETSLSPHQLLARLHAIEDELGRTRSEHWGPRTIDLDVLLFGDLVLDTPELTLPHARLAFRRFVLEPAVEVAADWRHPLLRWTLDELLAHLNTSCPYVAITGLPGAGKSRLAEAIAAQTSATLLSPIVNVAEVLASQMHDPSGLAMAIEIEFLAARTRLLLQSNWHADTSLAVSDFWFVQSLACAAARLSGEALTRFRKEFEVSQKSVVSPRLIVWLDVADRPLDADMRRIDASLAGLLHAGGHGPILRLQAADSLETQTAELLAAIAAMQPANP